jgi:cation diffusion facilitator CzcD-associated flavoprotein CzcO
MLYSLSFAPNPDFSTLLPGQEILRQIQDVANKLHVTRHVRFSVSWEGATWSEKTMRWTVTLKDVTTERVFQRECSILVSAVRGFGSPTPCPYEGGRRLAGRLFTLRGGGKI